MNKIWQPWLQVYLHIIEVFIEYQEIVSVYNFIVALNPIFQNEEKTDRKHVKKKVIYFWNCADVNKWLKKHCGQFHKLYGSTFMRHEISGIFFVCDKRGTFIVASFF